MHYFFQFLQSPLGKVYLCSIGLLIVIAFLGAAMPEPVRSVIGVLTAGLLVVVMGLHTVAIIWVLREAVRDVGIQNILMFILSAIVVGGGILLALAWWLSQ